MRAEYDALVTRELELKVEEGAEVTAISGPTFEDIINDTETPELSLDKIQKYNKRLGLTGRLGHGFVNGKHLEMDDVRQPFSLIID